MTAHRTVLPLVELQNDFQSEDGRFHDAARPVFEAERVIENNFTIFSTSVTRNSLLSWLEGARR